MSLEDGLKEAISRCSALQAAAEKSEQDIYKLKLKHQLELKELQRSEEQRDAPAINLPPPTSPQQQVENLSLFLNDLLTVRHSAFHKRVILSIIIILVIIITTAIIILIVLLEVNFTVIF